MVGRLMSVRPCLRALRIQPCSPRPRIPLIAVSHDQRRRLFTGHEEHNKRVEALFQKVAGVDLKYFERRYPNCHPHTHPFNLFRAHLADVLAALTGADHQLVYEKLRFMTHLDKGDFGVAVAAMRIQNRSVAQVLQECVDNFPTTDPFFEKPVALNDGQLSFFYKAQPLAEIAIPTIRSLGKYYGSNAFAGLRDPSDPGKGKKRIVVEFSSPNIAKPFHAGHLRSTIIGSFLANLYDYSGWDVVRVNYLGDWGKQYGLLAVAYERYGDEALLKQDPINHLYNLYVRINRELEEENASFQAEEGAGRNVSQRRTDSLDAQARHYFKMMTEGDEDALAQWKRFRALSIARYQATYERLNIHFDEYSGESQVSNDALAMALEKLQRKNLLTESNGAQVVDFPTLLPGKVGKRLGKAVIKKLDGTTLYLTRDIAELLTRADKYQFDKMLYVVATQQDLHLEQLFKIIQLMGNKELADRCEHVRFGLVQGMSTRRGTVKFLDDILDEVAGKMHEVMQTNEEKVRLIEDSEAVAQTLAINSIIVQDMNTTFKNNYAFSLDAMSAREGDTGVYLSYTYARITSVMRNARYAREDYDSADPSLLSEVSAVKVIRLMMLWPMIVQESLDKQEAAVMIHYLFRLARAVSFSYKQLWIEGQPAEVQKARLALYDAANTVMGNAARLLGVKLPERM